MTVDIRFSVLTVVASIVASVFRAGCATIFNGTDQEVRFESEPSKADVVIGGAKRGTTPTTLTLTKPGLNDKHITFEKEGYQEKSIVLQKEFATTAILNIFGPTFLGLGIDALSGALFNYSPSQYTVELESEMKSAQARTSDRSKWYSMRELQVSDQGHFLIPNHDQPVSVLDTDTGTVYVFR